MSPAFPSVLSLRGTKFTLGRRPGLGARPVRLSQRELFHHMLILGTTGSGKTTAALTILNQAVAAGWGVVLIDLKGDPENAALLAGAAKSARVKYSQFALTPGERRDTWNPLVSGDPSSRMSKVICLSQWTEPYYKSACERFAQMAFVLMERNRVAPSFDSLVALLDNPRSAHQLTGVLGPSDRERVEQYLSRIQDDRGQLSALAGLASRIGTLTDLSGPLCNLTSKKTINLPELSERGGVCVFSLNSARSQVIAGQIGALAVLDAQSMVAERIATGRSRRPVLVCIDEFSALDADHLLGLFARARSSRVAMVLATQELADLSRVRDGFGDQIIGLANTKLMMRQELPSSANTLAQLPGTTTELKTTHQTARSLFHRAQTGTGSEREVEKFIVHPNVFKRLRRGESVLLRKDPFRCERVNIRAALPQPDVAATRSARTVEHQLPKTNVHPQVPVDALDDLFAQSASELPQ